MEVDEKKCQRRQSWTIEIRKERKARETSKNLNEYIEDMKMKIRE